jgi:F-type H+-transporting ATPase subunit a
MVLTPDEVIYWQWGIVTVNATLVFTWLTMLVLVVGSRWVTRSLDPGPRIARGQAILELVVLQIRGQIEEAVGEDADRYVPFIGTMFLFIVTSTVLGAIPGVHVVGASLSTAAALATCVFLAVPLFGVTRRGLRRYLRDYIQPSVLMLPFHVMGELSRTLALAVRLFGNLMSGKVIVAVLLSVAPFVLPAALEAFGLLIGVIQAYVFAMLALVYIASGARSTRREPGVEVGSGAVEVRGDGHAPTSRAPGE